MTNSGFGFCWFNSCKAASKPYLQCRRFLFQRILSGIKDVRENKKEEHYQNFQNWAEFENRGFRRPEYMRSWIIEQYGPPEDVLRLETLDTPSNKYKSAIDARRTYLYQAVNHPNDVLVKVHAASLNPVDLLICQGYGSNLFNFRRDMLFDRVQSVISMFSNKKGLFADREFPLILGRDFSGTVVDVGSQVYDIQPGDEVYGAPSLFRSGALADYICADLSEVAQRPATLSHIEAASIPYVGLTVVSSLQELVSNGRQPKRALVIGGSGGIGTFAIQYLQAYGFTVVTTCSTTALQICNRLGADCIDYKLQDVDAELKEVEKFTIVFDPVGAASPEWASNCLYKGGTYVSLRSPLIELTNKYGAFIGATNTYLVYAMKKFQNSSINVKWGFFKTDRHALLEIARIIDSGMLKPVVNPENIHSFEDVPLAYKSLASGHTKGKIVVNVSGLPEALVKADIDKIIHL